MLKISTRLTLWYSLATGIVIVTMAFIIYFLFENQRRASIDEDLRNYAELLVNGIENPSLEISEIYNEMIENRMKHNKQRKTSQIIISTSDSVFFESLPNINIDSLVNFFEQKSIASIKPTFHTFKFENTEYRAYSLPISITTKKKEIKKNFKKDFNLIVVTSLDKLYESLSHLRSILFWLSPMSVLISGLIGFVIARKSLKPISEITKTAKEISSKNLDRRVPVGKIDDELSRLAKTFNDMINRLNQTFMAQQRFIADASHDIRTPLTVIQIELELLLKNSTLSDEIKFSLEKCLNEINRLNQITSDLMILARADAHQLIINKTLVRLDELAIDCVSKINNLARAKGITFKIDISNPIEINADYELITRSVINLLDNAIKFSPANEMITVSVYYDNDLAVFRINNKGNPIPDSQKNTIFNRFTKAEIARTTQKGSGLGLSIVKTIAEAHDGKISFESNLENGTTFYLFLPK
ncbi:MAG: HAMP domain-containing histidine kinase [Candidatus Kapabacteria bacterium]|nr:HAMP domain-containing histidine kinase [Candidatus Kapabacteria bacterium]